jgi:hypothetical protein
VNDKSFRDGFPFKRKRQKSGMLAGRIDNCVNSCGQQEDGTGNDRVLINMQQEVIKLIILTKDIQIFCSHAYLSLSSYIQYRLIMPI